MRQAKRVNSLHMLFLERSGSLQGAASGVSDLQNISRCEETCKEIRRRQTLQIISGQKDIVEEQGQSDNRIRVLGHRAE